MVISLHNVCPAPIPLPTPRTSEVWNTELCFQPSATTIISAESGKGKSTLINIILGTRRDYTGTALVDEKDVRTMSLDELAAIRKTKISVVPQNLQLFDHLSALDNILLKNNLTGRFPHTSNTPTLRLSRSTQTFHSISHIHAMLAQLEIEELANRPISQMSYGQRQRVAIVRSLCQPFEYLLLDEPFSHLDARTKDLAWQLITAEASQQKAGIILTTLNPSDFPALPHIRL